jgi:hypothetical protein
MIINKVTSKKSDKEETPLTEHPYQVNLANFEAEAVRKLFNLPDAPNSRVGQELYLYAIGKKLEENQAEITDAVKYINTFMPKS